MLKSFVIFGFSEDYVHYLPERRKEGDPDDESASGREVERSIEIGAVVYPEIERQLLEVQLTHPRGNIHIMGENNEKWREVLNGFLVTHAD